MTDSAKNEDAKEVNHETVSSERLSTFRKECSTIAAVCIIFGLLPFFSADASREFPSSQAVLILANMISAFWLVLAFFVYRRKMWAVYTNLIIHCFSLTFIVPVISFSLWKAGLKFSFWSLVPTLATAAFLLLMILLCRRVISTGKVLKRAGIPLSTKPKDYLP